MSQSMTGYASAVCETDGTTISTEIKSVNNRFLNINFKSHSSIERYEESLKSLIQSKIKRGSITVFIKIKSQNDNKCPEVNITAAKNLVSQLSDASKELNISRNITWDSLLKSPGIFDEAIEKEDPNLKDLLLKTLAKSLEQLETMRKNEGQRLISLIQDGVKKIEKLQSSISKNQENKKELHAKELVEKVNKLIEQLGDQSKIEQSDIAREISLIAERADISEEINRIESHCKEMDSILSQSSPKGKKLDFMCQELNREFNTICSKTKVVDISKAAVEGKIEVEQIREQVQNLE